MKPVQRYRALRKASLKGLQAFEAAYMHRSFASAAQELSITASAVSHSIQTLEEALGTLLFERARRGVVPTEAGARLFEVIRRSFGEIDDELRTILDRSSSQQQVVTIQCAPSFAAIWLMPRLPAFLRAHPDMDVRLWAVHQAPDFSNSGVDVAVTYGRPPASAGIHVEPISRRERYLPVCSPALVEGWTLPLPAADIENFYLIQNDVSLTSWDEWIARFAPGCLNPVRGLRLDRAFMTLSAAENGLGMCIESTVLVHDYLRDGRLVCPFGELAIEATAHYLAVPKSREGLGAVHTVLEWIRGFVDGEKSDPNGGA
ncbi:LysR substrate-binding domain-containing protein [Massilia litorea]|jgi:LysR family glycine cleavage system transcriptional activator|uniref:LysR family transcriptional regulator n=1 Tax=Massilia litorea TaxID=2769491 RepID=A0A7L9U2M1_9BURK|nr:LysR substrate-binding domain-containing protein [Massilia litorea]QOL48445.1 LysR family transcriptional regulator [Massilia litorea]